MEKRTVYVYWEVSSWQRTEDGELKAVFYKPTYCLEDHNLIGMFEIEIPEFPIPTQLQVNENRIEHLRHEKEKILADAFVEAQNIEEKIQSLLALPQEVL